MKAMTKRDIINAWKDNVHIDKYCCPDCRDTLSQCNQEYNLYHCDNDNCLTFSIKITESEIEYITRRKASDRFVTVSTKQSLSDNYLKYNKDGDDCDCTGFQHKIGCLHHKICI